jgi:hypothetical protein
MLKKITSLFAAGTLLAAGLLLVEAPASQAASITPSLVAAGAPGYNSTNPMPKSAVSIAPSVIISAGFSVGNISWSPSVATNFAANTVYTATVLLTADAGNTFAGMAQNSIAVSGSGAAGVTVTHNAITAGANSVSVSITFPDTGSGSQQQQQQQQVQMVSTATSSNVTDSSVTVDWATLAAAHSGVATWRVYVRNVTASPAVLLGYYDIAGSVHSLTVTGLSAGTNYNFFMAEYGGQQINGNYVGFEPGLIVTTTGSGGGSNDLQAQLAAIAQAAAAKAAAVAKAQTTLVDTFKANKPATLSDMSSSDFAISQQATVDRINKTVLDLQAKNPGVALSIAAIKDVVAKESIVEKISTAVTQGNVQTAQLVKAGLIDSTNSVKSSVMNALKTMDPTSLNTLDKLKAAIAAQTKVAQDRYARTRAIVAKIGASK